MKNLKKLSRIELKEIAGGLRNPYDDTMSPVGGDGATGCKQCVTCQYSGVGSFKQCYTDPNGDCANALRIAQSLC